MGRRVQDMGRKESVLENGLVIRVQRKEGEQGGSIKCARREILALEPVIVVKSVKHIRSTRHRKFRC